MLLQYEFAVRIAFIGATTKGQSGAVACHEGGSVTQCWSGTQRRVRMAVASLVLLALVADFQIVSGVSPYS